MAIGVHGSLFVNAVHAEVSEVYRVTVRPELTALFPACLDQRPCLNGVTNREASVTRGLDFVIVSKSGNASEPQVCFALDKFQARVTSPFDKPLLITLAVGLGDCGLACLFGFLDLFAFGQRAIDQRLQVCREPLAQADKFPDWKAGNEFKAKRDAMLKK